MIAKGSQKLEPFIRDVARRVTGSGDATFSDIDDLWYLGGGYWRARVVTGGEDGEGDPVGIALNNPSLSWADVQKVEEAVAILLYKVFRTA